MAATKYSQHVGKAERRPGMMPRSEWLTRAKELAPRGQDLPHTKLLDLDIVSIRSAERQRKALLKHISENLTNAALAKQFGVHRRTIEKVLARETGCHVA